VHHLLSDRTADDVLRGLLVGALVDDELTREWPRDRAPVPHGHLGARLVDVHLVHAEPAPQYDLTAVGLVERLGVGVQLLVGDRPWRWCRHALGAEVDVAGVRPDPLHDPVQVVGLHEHLARIAALRRADDVGLLKHLHHPPGVRVPEPQLPLQHRR
jgi:hypothetical protein